MTARPFEIICEIEPPVRPDLTHARHQIGVLTAVSSTFLIPVNRYREISARLESP
jgi:methylenetetrahydrofolate reductase (NADPH)